MNMDSAQSQGSEDPLTTEELFEADDFASSSESEISIIIEPEPEESPKMKLYKLGLYSPGSGEICTKYITMSRSSMIRHPYYAYPGIKDPGIEKALLYPELEKIYDEDGQELYLDLCKQMNVVPVRCFYRDLKKEAINLRYYGVDPKGVRAMCLALAYNQNVKRLDLTSNFLDHRDACYHLGQMLGDRNGLEELIMDGCNIGHEGMRRLTVYLRNRKMKLLDLSCNHIRDEGFKYLANEIYEGAVFKSLKLRRNELTSDCLPQLAEAIEFNDTIRYLDLSWNQFVKPKGINILLRQLGVSEVLVELNLSWTGLAVVDELKNLFSIESLKKLILNNNKLSTPAARIIARNLYMSKSLKSLNVSCNPFTPSDAYLLLMRMKPERIKLKELRMDHIVVSKEFAIELKQILKLPYRQHAKITHGDVLRNYTLPEFDLKIITMKSLVNAIKKKRKCKLDILLYFMEQNKTRKFLDTSELNRTLKIYDAPIREDLMENLVKLFPGPKADTGNRTINLNIVVDYIHRLWPNKKLPPTPPPTPPPEPLPPTKKKGKGKKGKK